MTNSPRQHLIDIADPETLRLWPLEQGESDTPLRAAAALAEVDGSPIALVALRQYPSDHEAHELISFCSQASVLRVPIVSVWLGSDGGAESSFAAATPEFLSLVSALTSAAEVPRIALYEGVLTGDFAMAAAASSDITVAMDPRSRLLSAPPEVIASVTGVDWTACSETFERSGLATHYLGADPSDAIDFACVLLSYLPRNAAGDPPAYDVPVGMEGAAPLPTASVRNHTYDVLELICALVDDADFLQLHSHLTQSLLTGFARLGGRSVGIVANDPSTHAGLLDADGIDSLERFSSLCTRMGIPMISLLDTFGFMPTSPEAPDLARALAVFTREAPKRSVPGIAVTIGRHDGLAGLCMSRLSGEHTVQIHPSLCQVGDDPHGGIDLDDLRSRLLGLISIMARS